MSNGNDPEPLEGELVDAAPAGECGHEGVRAGAKFCTRCGQALASSKTTAAAFSPNPALVAWGKLAALRPSLGPAARRWVKWGGAVVVALVVVGVTALYVVQGRYYSPEEPVTAYLDALEAGDGPAVAELLGVEGRNPLLEPGALDEGYAPPERMEISGVEHGVSTELDDDADYHQRPDMDYARVTISYQLDGEEYEHEISVHRDDSGMFRQWHLVPELLSSEVGASISHTSNEAHQIANIETDFENDLIALPGVYDVSISGDSLYEDATGKATVPINDSGTASIDRELRPGIVEEVQNQVNEKVDECISQTGMPDNSCGFRDSSGRLSLIPSSAEWSLNSYPEIDIEEHTESDPDIGPIITVTTTPGEASTEYTNVAGGSRSVTVEIIFHGHITAGDGDAITWHSRVCEVGQDIC